MINPCLHYKLFASGDPVVATSEVPTTADDYLAIARASAGKKGREQTVIRLAEQSLKLRESGNGFFLVATHKGLLGKYQEAIAGFNKAIKIYPEDFQSYSNRGIIKRILRDYKGAIADYNKALAINPQNVAAYTNRGVAKGFSGDVQGMCLDFRKIGRASCRERV